MPTWLQILALMELVFLYIRTRLGAIRYYRYFKNDILSVNPKSVKPARFIAHHFGIEEKSIPLGLYLRFLVVYIIFLQLFVLAGVALFCPSLFLPICTATVLLLCAYSLCSLFVFDIPTEVKKNKGAGTKKAVPSNTLKNHNSILKTLQELKEDKWVYSLTTQINRCKTIKKNENYLPRHNIHYVEREILPNYKKHMHYSIEEEDGNCRLLIYSKKSKRCVMQLQIK